jgi:hypothetical protein
LKRFNAAKGLQAAFKVRTEYLLAGTGTMFIAWPEKRNGYRKSGRSQLSGQSREAKSAHEVRATKAEL